jgi:SAM-dependent methyltransferase
MDRPTWAPADVDIERPSPARIYDYFLGGSHNFAADRALAEQFIAAAPDTRLMARANRAFLHRAVRFLVDVGVRQFLDLGSGMPSRGSVHEIAHRAAPQARVVYVDIDPVAVAHSQAILAGNDRAGVIQADLRHPATVLNHPVRAMLDLDQPAAVLLVSVLHFVADADEPAAIVARYAEALAPGSYLVISHLTTEANPQQMAAGARLSQRAAIPATPRSRTAVTSLFSGLTLVEPGLVWAPLWRPDPGDDTDDPHRCNFLVGVGGKPPAPGP